MRTAPPEQRVNRTAARRDGMLGRLLGGGAFEGASMWAGREPSSQAEGAAVKRRAPGGRTRPGGRVHAKDRQGLERLCRYGARGALALERLSRAEDGRIAYRMKRPLPDGTTHLLFTGLELLRRLASLVPPPRANLTRFHGVFAPGAKLRPFLVPQAGEEGASEAPEAARSKEPKKKRTPRVDQAQLLRRTFGVDVFTCAGYGGKRRVLAYLTAPNAVRAIVEHLSLPTRPACAGRSAGATPAHVVLSLEPSRCPRRPHPCGRPLEEPSGPACAPWGCTASPLARHTARMTPVRSSPRPLGSSPLPPHGPHSAYTLRTLRASINYTDWWGNTYWAYRSRTPGNRGPNHTRSHCRKHYNRPSSRLFQPTGNSSRRNHHNELYKRTSCHTPHRERSRLETQSPSGGRSHHNPPVKPTQTAQRSSSSYSLQRTTARDAATVLL
ncbi:transposase [Cystobacter fuscus]|nr:transposase [Cystobacter fuscus]